MELLLILILGGLLALLVGGILGWAAFFNIRRVEERLRILEGKVADLRSRPVPGETSKKDLLSEIATAPPEPPKRPPPPLPSALQPKPSPPAPTPPSRQEPTVAERGKPAARKALPAFSMEMLIGGRFMAWAGALIFLVAVGFFLKHAYENEWIGPGGRLMIGAITGAAFLAVGEFQRRKGTPVISQILIGAGFAIFYLCIYFAFEVYGVWGQGTAFAAAFVVTVAALTASVLINAMSTALLALLGGLLSPVMLSLGGNQTVILFSYLLILDLLALGSALYRNWRPVQILAFAGTALLGIRWYDRYYDPSQLGIAVFFLSVFYLLFLLVPLLYSYRRRIPGDAGGVLLLAGNSLFAFAGYAFLLYNEHRPWLTVAVVAQAALILGLYFAWHFRMREDRRTSLSLLMIGLSLVLAAAPIQFRLYALPIVWAVEGALLAFIARRFASPVAGGFSLLAVLLATAGLVYRLPLHTIDTSAPIDPERIYTPIFNRPFLSWWFAIACIGAAGVWFSRLVDRLEQARDRLTSLVKWLPWGLAVFLAATVLHLEVSAYWKRYAFLYEIPLPWGHRAESLTVLWGTMGAGLALLGGWIRQPALRWLSVPVLLFGTTVMGREAVDYDASYRNLLFNWRFFAGGWFAAACILAGLLLLRANKEKTVVSRGMRAFWSWGLRILGAVLFITLLHEDVGAFWEVRSGELAENRLWAWRAESLTLLWGLIPLGFAAVGRIRRSLPLFWGTAGAAAVGLLFLLSYLGEYAHSGTLFFSTAFGARLAFVLSLWTCAGLWRSLLSAEGKTDESEELPPGLMEIAGHLLMLVLLAVEIPGWSAHSERVTEAFGQGLLSAAFSGYALFLIGFGLIRGVQFRRVFGFLLFAAVAGKIFLYDTRHIETVYRILSFAATGLLLLTASFLYNRYALKWLERP